MTELFNSLSGRQNKGREYPRHGAWPVKFRQVNVQNICKLAYGLQADMAPSAYGCSRGRKPSVSVCMKTTSASSSASDRPRFPTLLLFMLSVDSGAGQHVVPSPASWGLHRGRTSRVL